MWARNRPTRFHLFNKRHDPSEGDNVAHRHRGVVHHLYGLVRAKAGRLPYYSGVDRDG